MYYYYQWERQLFQFCALSLPSFIAHFYICPLLVRKEIFTLFIVVFRIIKFPIEKFYELQIKSFLVRHANNIQSRPLLLPSTATYIQSNNTKHKVHGFLFPELCKHERARAEIVSDTYPIYSGKCSLSRICSLSGQISWNSV